MKKTIIIVIVMLVHLFGESQNTIITGEASDYALWNLYVFEEDDLFTSRRNLLSTHTTDDKGHFRIEIPVRETGPIFLSIADKEALLFVEPGKKYTVAFPRTSKEKTTRTFDKNTVELQLSTSDPNELNTLIRQFNADVATFVDEHYFDFALDQYRGSETFLAGQEKSGKRIDMFKRRSGPDSSATRMTEQAFGNALRTFRTDIEKKYNEGFRSSYFAEYVRYSMADIEMWAGASRKKLYSDYFMSQPTQWRNPAWTDFVTLFWSGSYEGLQKDTQAELMRSINAENSWQASIKALEKDSICSHETLRSVVFLEILKAGWYNNTFNRIAISRTLDKAQIEEPDLTVKRLAANLKYQLLKGKSGWEIEPFVLLDAQKNKWSVDQQRGRYIYFFFFANWCTACKKELLYLQSLQEKYNKTVQIVAVNMDTEYSEFETFLRENPSLRFEFLIGAGDPLLRQKMDVRALPHAVLIDPNGKVVADYTRRPSEGLNLEFEKLQKLLSPATGGRTWRD